MQQNQPRGTTESPGQRTGYAQVRRSLDGRMEKRLPIILVVRLSPMPDSPTNEEERTYTDNVSGHGVRVFSGRSWRPGEQAQVTALNEESPMHGEVVYCQRLDSEHYCVGLKVQARPVTWAVLRRYIDR